MTRSPSTTMRAKADLDIHRMIKCIVFDFDGTLVDSNDIKRETFYEIVLPWDTSGQVVDEVFQRWPAADRYEKTRKIAETLISRKLLPADSCADTWGKRLAEDYTMSCEKAITRCPERPGASQALRDLTAMGLLLYVNSGTPAEPLRRILELRNWAHFFQAVYGAEGSKAGNLENIASACGAVRQEIVHVGDQLDDLRGARQFGCHFVAMAARGTAPEIMGNDLLVDDLRGLAALVAGLS